MWALECCKASPLAQEELGGCPLKGGREALGARLLAVARDRLQAGIPNLGRVVAADQHLAALEAPVLLNQARARMSGTSHCTNARKDAVEHHLPSCMLPCLMELKHAALRTAVCFEGGVPLEWLPRQEGQHDLCDRW